MVMAMSLYNLQFCNNNVLAFEWRSMHIKHIVTYNCRRGSKNTRNKPSQCFITLIITMSDEDIIIYVFVFMCCVMMTWKIVVLNWSSLHPLFRPSLFLIELTINQRTNYLCLRKVGTLSSKIFGDSADIIFNQYFCLKCQKSFVFIHSLLFC